MVLEPARLPFAAGEEAGPHGADREGGGAAHLQEGRGEEFGAATPTSHRGQLDRRVKKMIH